jgi:signal recognition particle receptor subunit beta
VTSGGISPTPYRAAEERLHECREVFAETLRDPHLSGKPIVVFANKQDLPTAVGLYKLSSVDP